MRASPGRQRTGMAPSGCPVASSRPRTSSSPAEGAPRACDPGTTQVLPLPATEQSEM